ncbi:MAG TPA: Gfo/Idh/MocA family oxidoreductase [Bryobacteraceae bacterium]|nr:Gfo/Idh/MocA family oxidoreductase [Bryobacteraceae bacterium]
MATPAYNSQMDLNSRREFLKGTSRIATTGALAIAASSYSRVSGANERINLGLIGAGDRGTHVMGLFQNNPAIHVTAVCDIYGQRLQAIQQKAPGSAAFADHRAVLARNDVDAVLIATPDHWHCAIAIDALNAGKDVYVEKPLTRVPEEGPMIVKAARENNRVCQVGMQQRSAKHYLQAKEKYFDSGQIGDITLARTWWHGNSWHLRKAPASLQTKPADLDWAHFLGPLKWRDYDPQQYFNWRAYLDYGGGQVTDLFTHWIDVVHMFMGKDVPFSASAAGGVYHYKDGRTAPDTINVLLQYPGQNEFTATFEATLAPGITGYGIEMCGTNGRLWIDRSRYEYYPVQAKEPAEVVKAEVMPGTNDSLTQSHVNNFVDCVKSRHRPNGDVLIGHRSAQASHLGNISYAQRRRIDFDMQREEILPL